MPQTIQIKRGLKAHLPTLLAGEMAFCTDTKEIYVGDGTNNTVVGRVMTGTEATRPNAGVSGRLYYVTSGTNTGYLYLDTGSAWVKTNILNIDELPDGSTYGRVKKSELNNGTVNRLNDGTNTVTASEAKTHINDATKHRTINDNSTTTTNLWSASKVNTEIYNAIRGLEWQDSVKNKSTTTPPTTNTKDDRYIIPSGASGAWTGKTNQIAHWNGSAWEYYPPQVGWSVYVDGENKNYVFNGTNWVKSGEANQSVVAGNGLTGGGSSDTINLTVKPYNGINVDANGVGVKASNGITVTSAGVGVKASNGIAVDANGVGVKAGSGVTVDVNGVKVNAGNTMVIDSGTNKLEVAYGQGLALDGNGLLGVDVDWDTLGMSSYNAEQSAKLFVAKVDGGTF